MPNKDVQNALSLKYTDLSIAYLKKLNFINSLYYFIFFSNKNHFFERLFKKTLSVTNKSNIFNALLLFIVFLLYQIFLCLQSCILQ